jgi:hypothetical protein
VFDLKTRATLPIRIDVGNHSKYTAYRLLKEKGQWSRVDFLSLTHCACRQIPLV